MLAGLDDDLDGIDTGTANFEEVVGSTHLLDFQYVGENGAEELFLFTHWSHIFGSAFHLGSRQGLAVDLAVGRHRHAVHLHVSIRHHVVGKRRGGEGLADGFVVDGGTIDHSIVEHQVLVAHHFAHLGSSLADALDVQGLALDFSEFDAEATQFHLGVDTSHILYLTILTPTTEVARMVHADRTSPTVFLDERTVNE